MVLDKSARSTGPKFKGHLGDFSKTLSQEQPGSSTAASEVEGLPAGWTRKIKDGRVVYVTVAGEERTQPPEGLYKLELVDGSISSYVVKLAKGQEAPEYPLKASQRVQVVESHDDAEAGEGEGQKLAGFAFNSLFLRKLQREALGQGQRRVDEKKKKIAEKKRLARSKEVLQADEDAGPKEPFAEVSVEILEAIGLAGCADIPDLGSASKVRFMVKNFENGKLKVGYETSLRGGQLDGDVCSLNLTAKVMAMSPQDVVLVRIFAVRGGKRLSFWSSKKEEITEDLIVRAEIPLMQSNDVWESMVGPQGQTTDAKVHFRIKVTQKTVAFDPSAQTGLPPGWQAYLTPEGRIFYVHSLNETTQWEHPSSEPINLPRAWVKTTDDQGRVAFENIASSGVLGDLRNKIVYVNPSEPECVRQTRGEMVKILLGLKSLMAVDDADETLERANIEDRASLRNKSITEAMVLSEVQFTKFRGRFLTFKNADRPETPKVVWDKGLKDTVIDPTVIWPHGLHKLGDRPWLLQNLRQRDTLGAISRRRAWDQGGAGGAVYNLEQALLGHIPLHETTCFIRFGTDKPGKWDEQYLELSLQSKDEDNAQHLLLWGPLASPLQIKTDKSVINVKGRVLASKVTSPVRRLDLSDYEFRSINDQCLGALGGTTPLYSFEFRTKEHGMVSIAMADTTMVESFVEVFHEVPDPSMVKLAPLGPHRMAAAGFFFSPTTGENDRVRCPFCNFHKSGWKVGMDPEEVHQRSRPDCSYVAAWDGEVDMELPAAEGNLAHAAVARDLLKWTTTRNKALGRAKEKTVGPVIGIAPGDTLRRHRQVMNSIALGGPGDELLERATANDLVGLNRLLAMGVPVNFADGGLRTALHWGAAMGNAETCKLLILSGADVNAKTAMGFTPLALAGKGGFSSLQTALRQAGAKE